MSRHFAIGLLWDATARSRKLRSLPISELDHALRVSALVEKYDRASLLGAQAALLHDVVEDHYWTCLDLSKAGMSPSVVDIVRDLINVFDATRFSYLDRTERKNLEAKRLGSRSTTVRTVKLCDRLDNLRRIAKKPGVTAKFLRMYVYESATLVAKLKHGGINPALVQDVRDAARDLLRDAESVSMSASRLEAANYVEHLRNAAKARREERVKLVRPKRADWSLGEPGDPPDLR
jgi:DNA-binding MarR family transcriptional regulator